MYRNDAYWKKIRGVSVFGLFAIPFWVIGLGLVVQSAGEWGVWLALQIRGVQTDATIIQCKKEVDDETTYLVVYDYQAKGDTYRRQNREEVSPAWFPECETGAKITVRYLPHNRSVVRIEGNTFQRNYLTVVGCWICILAVTFGILLFVARTMPVTMCVRRRLATIFNGGCVGSVVTLIGWIIEFIAVDALGNNWGFWGLCIGLLAGVIAALLTWFARGTERKNGAVSDSRTDGGLKSSSS
ncbi:DUF3592 domain-containing protein [candidate division KSB1 bacterium]|nr:DUF3592 domain-containing protein [candidate division KSB1 bacterium]